MTEKVVGWAIIAFFLVAAAQFMLNGPSDAWYRECVGGHAEQYQGCR